MMPALPDISANITEAMFHGHTTIPGLLNLTLVTRLLGETAAAHFIELDCHQRLVSQRGTKFVTGPDDWGPHAAEVAKDLTTAAHASGAERLRNFIVNEVTFQRYVAPGDGVSAHRDRMQYTGLIAIFTLLGEGYFDVLAKREGPVIARHLVAPGDAILIRGLGRKGIEDRPMHRIGPPIGAERVSVTFRMNELLLAI